MFAVGWMDGLPDCQPENASVTQIIAFSVSQIGKWLKHRYR